MKAQPRRDWKDARAKCDRECCRVCGDPEVEAAHVIGRAADRKRGYWVDPDGIVPLCKPHHAAYDAHSLDLVGLLTPAEEALAVLDAGGLENARRRLCPSAYREAA